MHNDIVYNVTVDSKSNLSELNGVTLVALILYNNFCF